MSYPRWPHRLPGLERHLADVWRAVPVAPPFSEFVFWSFLLISLKSGSKDEISWIIYYPRWPHRLPGLERHLAEVWGQRGHVGIETGSGCLATCPMDEPVVTSRKGRSSSFGSRLHAGMDRARSFQFSRALRPLANVLVLIKARKTYRLCYALLGC